MLQPVRYQNEQWRVTDRSIESLDPQSEYVIPLSEILKIRDAGGALYDWPVQMSEKSWVDIEAFIAAFLFAVNDVPFDRIMLNSSIEQARRRS